MLKIYTDPAEAQRTILRRNKSDSPLPQSLRQSLSRIFGREVTPSDAVTEILADVRSRGDAPLREMAQRTRPDRPNETLFAEFHDATISASRRRTQRLRNCSFHITFLVAKLRN